MPEERDKQLQGNFWDVFKGITIHGYYTSEIGFTPGGKSANHSGRLPWLRAADRREKGLGENHMPANTYDAIIVGSGITGGWAAKELTEKGLNTLVLEAGRSIDPGPDYVEHVPVWELKYRNWDDRAEAPEDATRAARGVLRVRRILLQIFCQRRR